MFVRTCIIGWLRIRTKKTPYCKSTNVIFDHTAKIVEKELTCSRNRRAFCPVNLVKWKEIDSRNESNRIESSRLVLLKQTASKARKSREITLRNRCIAHERRESNAARNSHRGTANETKMTDRPIRWNTSTHENATTDDRRFSLATDKREGQKPKTDYV